MSALTWLLGYFEYALVGLSLLVVGLTFWEIWKGRLPRRRPAGFRMADDEPLRLNLPERFRNAEGE